ncbi:prolyl oligopeptidase family protein [Melghiribacillus thermohalophilus]|uniref:Prolyl oligopeptidase family protein n=1 Tax=Melghiribacillus thermohalophilus TaxID=1324956 RepID=A0A4R3MPP9_9BACI|nr:prolyl oligopeptidase family serine peptidase [Melghiribacillus thermohalophilus]TCT17515.1 prolyl oligopeptidase family protein [Melghiribacillus thermohalophilus]
MKDGQVLDQILFPSPHPDFRVYLVTYKSSGLNVKGFLVEPKDQSQTYPALLYLRGGIKNVGKVRLGRIIQFASEGFIVFAPFYRGNMGGEGREDFGLQDRNDALNGIRVLQQHFLIQSGKIYVFGFSRGGLMALWTAIQSEDVLKVVTWGGVSDLRLTYEERVDLRRMLKRVTGGTPRKVPDEYDKRTPLPEIRRMDCPVLLIHGENDQNVSVEHARRLERELEKWNKPYDFWLFEAYDHYFPPDMNRKLVRKLCIWLKN